jgi:hypothetical protein
MISAAEFLKWCEVFGIKPGGGNITIPVSLAQGGTGAALTASNGSLFYSTASVGALLPTLADGVLVTNGSGIPSISTTLPAGLTITGYLKAANNLSDVSSVSTARTNLGLNSMALQPSNSVSITGGSIAPTTLNFNFVYANVSGNANLVVTDNNVLFEMTAPNIGISDVLGLSAFTNGFQFIIKNTSTGNVTFTPKSGDTIDGQSVLTLLPTQSVLIAKLSAEWGACSIYLSDAAGGVTSIIGTANQVIASASTGAITLSLPQSIATTSNVTFNSITLPNGGHLLDPNGNVYLTFNATVSAINNVAVSNSITGVAPLLQAEGIDTNVALALSGQGTGGIYLMSGSNTVPIAHFLPTASAVNYFEYISAISGQSPLLGVVGSDTNVGLNIVTQGAGSIVLFAGGTAPGNILFEFLPVASSVNYITTSNNITGNNPNITATGSDTTVGFDFRSKGGVFQFYDIANATPALINLYSNTGHSVGLTVPSGVSSSITFALPDVDGSSGYVLTTDGAGNLSFQAGGGGGGGITNGGINTGELLFGTSSTTAQSSSLNVFDTGALCMYLLGANTVTNNGASDSLAVGTLHTFGSSGNNSSIFGYQNTANGNLSFAMGIGCTVNGGQGLAFGTDATQTNAGSFVFTDSTGGTPPTDSAGDQFVMSFVGGFYHYVGATLATSIDTNSNFINHQGTADQSKVVTIPTTGQSITFSNNVKTIILNPATTLAALTIVMPAAPIDGQEVRFSCSQIVSTLTVSPNAGQSLLNAPVAFVAGQGFSFIYNVSTTTWYRLY